MAGYSKGIVDTRKLNKNSKAKLGRGGDTKIREVSGRDSHVNALEAYLIDVNGKAGEDYAKRVGAGTVNPLTGMPEYWDPLGDITDWAYETFAVPYVADIAEESFKEMGSDIYDVYGGARGKLDYDTAKDMSQTELQNYLYQEFDVSKDQMKYIKGFQQKPFDFLGETQALTTKGLESSYGATMGALGSQQEALSRGTGRGLRAAGQGRDTAISRSGLATSGTITQAYETQKKDLFQDYTAGMGDIKRERGTALDTLTLGKEGAGLDFRTAEYAEKQRQLDELYADVAAIPA